MIMTVLRQQPRAAGLVLGLIAANLLAWCWALQAFGDSGALMAASLLISLLGLAQGPVLAGPLIDCGIGLGGDCRDRHGLQRADELAA